MKELLEKLLEDKFEDIFQPYTDEEVKEKGLELKKKFDKFRVGVRQSFNKIFDIGYDPGPDVNPVYIRSFDEKENYSDPSPLVEVFFYVFDEQTTERFKKRLYKDAKKAGLKITTPMEEDVTTVQSGWISFKMEEI